jgi:hypothetical protein
MQPEHLPIDYDNFSCTTYDRTEGKKYAKTICAILRDNTFINGNIQLDQQESRALPAG